MIRHLTTGALLVALAALGTALPAAGAGTEAAPVTATSGGTTADPADTEPTPTDPEPTDPEPTDPAPTEPPPTEPPAPPVTPKRPVIVLGDSLTYRGEDKLHARRPAWVVDGVRGRNVTTLLPLMRQHLRATPRPRAVVVALGTNGSRRWTMDHYRRAARMVPRGTDVVFVTPYRAVLRQPTRPGVAPIDVNRYGRWMQRVAKAAPARRCVAPWAHVARRKPWLLTDGVHQIDPAGESAWARLVVAAVDRCADRPNWR